MCKQFGLRDEEHTLGDNKAQLSKPEAEGEVNSIELACDATPQNSISLCIAVSTQLYSQPVHQVKFE